MIFDPIMSLINGLRTKVGNATLTTTAQDLSGGVNELNDQIATLENNQAYRAGDVITIPCEYRLFTARCGWSGSYAQMQVVLDKPVIGTITSNNVTLPYDMQMFVADKNLIISNQSVYQVQNVYKNLVQLLITVSYDPVFVSNAVGVLSCTGNLTFRVT